ncbi:hypothetical protein IF655_00600 [Streptomyces sp. DSM 110735]|uniref:hypothetical protein n=1 Tax=Streptomyces sp. DSM 110735 TaxID=2775031 RepID=UPI0018F75F56|nr:hypothetical protein [Streptomyces sp. DSM 110735]MBJ7901800.1 hypothetical protein [Streptomyces sp. DSM 110735]
MDRWGPEEVEHGAVGDGDHWPTAADGGQGPYDHPQAHSYGPPAPPAPRRSGGSTVLLVVVALVVALGAGGSVYALLHEGRPTATPPVDPQPEASVPAAWVGTWLAPDHRLTLTPGHVGDSVLTLVTHHCAATARLTAVTPTSLRFTAHPATCATDPPTTLTLLPDGRLTGGGLIFRRAPKTT